MVPSDLRDRLTSLVYVNGGKKDPVGRMEWAFDLHQEAEEPYVKWYRAAASGKLDGDTFALRLKSAVAQNIITQAEADLVAEYDKARFEAILTDDFPAEYFASSQAGVSHENVVEIDRQVA